MNSTEKFLREKGKGLDRGSRRLLKDVLKRIPEGLDVSSIREIAYIYLGLAYAFRRDDWVIFLDWNLLHKPEEAPDRRGRKLEEERARGVIALNLAHFALGHVPARIHLPSSYAEARELALRWGFEREVKEMEKGYL